MNLTHKLIIFAVIFNIMLTGLNTYKENQDSTVADYFGWVESQTSLETEVDEPETLIGSALSQASQFFESTVGNLWRMGTRIWSFFFDAINPLSISPNRMNDVVTQSATYFLIGFRSLIITVIMFIQAYKFFKNKND